MLLSGLHIHREECYWLSLSLSLSPSLSLSLSLCDYEVFRRISFDFPFNIQKIKIYVEWKKKEKKSLTYLNR